MTSCQSRKNYTVKSGSELSYPVAGITPREFLWRFVTAFEDLIQVPRIKILSFGQVNN